MMGLEHFSFFPSLNLISLETVWGPPWIIPALSRGEASLSMRSLLGSSAGMTDSSHAQSILCCPRVLPRPPEAASYDDEDDEDDEDYENGKGKERRGQ